MAYKIKCPNCNEIPYRWQWAYDDMAVLVGKECSLCHHIRPTKPRHSAKSAKLNALINELLGREAL